MVKIVLVVMLWTGICIGIVAASDCQTQLEQALEIQDTLIVEKTDKYGTKWTVYQSPVTEKCYEIVFAKNGNLMIWTMLPECGELVR